jgi:hypothetical protein
MKLKRTRLALDRQFSCARPGLLTCQHTRPRMLAIHYPNEVPMASSSKSGPRKAQSPKQRLSRRQLLTQGATLGAASALMAGCSGTKSPPDPLSDDNLIGASALSGKPLSLDRVHGMKLMLEFTLKQLETLREFDPDEEEPLTMFRL